MVTCPSCGHSNPESAARCELCGRPLLIAAAGESQGESAGQAPAPPPAATPPPMDLPPPPPLDVRLPPPGAMPPPPPFTAGPGMAPPPIPFRQQMTAGQKRGRYFIGIGLGFLPVLLSVAIFFGLASGSAAVGPNAPLSAILNVLGFLPCLLGLGGLGFMIYCFTQERLRFIGYGMLTVFVALPVIAAISCIAIISGVGRV